MTFFSIRFARLTALSLLLVTSGCTINTHNSSEPSSGGEAPKEEKPKPKPKKKKKPAEEKPEAKPEKPEPEAKPERPKPEKPKPEVEKPEKPKPEKPKPEVEKPASKPDKPKDEPVVEKPKDDKPKEEKPKNDKPAPQPERSKIVLPIKIALDVIEKELDALIPTTDKKDWAQITKGNESPKAELKYELWRDPIKLDLEGNTFQIKVPVRYAATVRAQVKNPLTKDWFWIAKDETWGTKADPQRLTAYFEAKLSVSDDWKIKSELKLVKLEHGDAPTGDICKTVAVKVCVSKSSIAGEVREGIDKKLEPKLTKALAKVDSKVERAFDLQKRATAIWAQLQRPQALSGMTDTWLVVRPTAAGVSDPAKEGNDVVVELAIEGKLSVESGKKPKIAATPLSKVERVEGEPGFHIVADLRLPREALTASLDKVLKGLTAKNDRSGKLQVFYVKVIALADEQHPRQLVLKLGFSPVGGDELEFRGEVDYDAGRQRLRIKNFEITEQSRSYAAHQLGGIDLKALEKELAAKAHLDLSDETGPLKKAILEALDATLRGQAVLNGQLKQLDVQKVDVKPESIEARVIVGGDLEVQVKR